MKLDEKRQVIEVLLCGASARWVGYTEYPVGMWTAALHLEVDSRSARRRWGLAHADYSNGGYATTYMTICLEAAYRLIESSPTLRREWFGR